MKTVEDIVDGVAGVDILGILNTFKVVDVYSDVLVLCLCSGYIFNHFYWNNLMRFVRLPLDGWGLLKR